MARELSRFELFEVFSTSLNCLNAFLDFLRDLLKAVIIKKSQILNFNLKIASHKKATSQK